MSKLKVYEVVLKASVSRHEKVAASSPEEAAKLAIEMCRVPLMTNVSFSARWLEEQDVVEETGELSIEILGTCDECGAGITSQTVDGQPWNWAPGDENCYSMLCYPCAMKRKEAGNYCPHYERFYRCESCPLGEPCKHEWEGSEG